MQDCCSELEARGASGYKEETTNDEMMAQIQRDTSRVEYRIGNRWFDTVPSGKAAENSKAKIVISRNHFWSGDQRDLNRYIV